MVLTGDLRLNGRDYERRTLKACSGYVMQAKGREGGGWGTWGSLLGVCSVSFPLQRRV